MNRTRSLFDVIGPVMIGPSSSHTAGAVRLGRLARAILGSQPARARILLHGSFASTGRGHGTDLSLAAGLMDMRMDDPGIRDALRVAADRGLQVTFEDSDLGDRHPNTARLELEDAAGRTVAVTGSSLGGAEIVVTHIDDFDVDMTGELPTLVVTHVDRPGVIAGVTAALAEGGANIATMSDSREKRGERALMLVQTDAVVSGDVVRRIESVHDVAQVRAVPAV
jgi:L-serine dehydratase